MGRSIDIMGHTLQAIGRQEFEGSGGTVSPLNVLYLHFPTFTIAITISEGEVLAEQVSEENIPNTPPFSYHVIGGPDFESVKNHRVLRAFVLTSPENSETEYGLLIRVENGGWLTYYEDEAGFMHLLSTPDLPPGLVARLSPPLAQMLTGSDLIPPQGKP
jgi:hypothetical protein